ncbi:uncharacterized protein LY79DRAFT_557992 [Colletotrichum navitas]|uniref:Uncharacterized protein n=1 Tax=Colletotrichum navitas TaxID=681940 RepID=A0AAD8PWV3_9PEZI|nr:uncharacterized protein LY79DRAFT_557992 [Colletotrichum navitas]KAK1585645.1 hypothetical protein LY79DRAFT_557992 [Colletotrichum navitas]
MGGSVEAIVSAPLHGEGGISNVFFGTRLHVEDVCHDIQSRPKSMVHGVPPAAAAAAAAAVAAVAAAAGVGARRCDASGVRSWSVPQQCVEAKPGWVRRISTRAEQSREWECSRAPHYNRVRLALGLGCRMARHNQRCLSLQRMQRRRMMGRE